MKRFEDKVAIITGGAQGIGEATTRRLANEGAMTAILDIQLEKAQAVAEEILSQGGKKSIAVKMDVTDSQEVKRAVREVEETFGRVDVLINNVGMEELGLFIESTEESWDWKIAVNLKGPMTVTKAVLEGMVPRKYGRIVNMSSDAGRAGQFGEAAYGACKAGIIALTKVRARELMEHNITVNSVSPSAQTELYDLERLFRADEAPVGLFHRQSGQLFRGALSPRGRPSLFAAGPEAPSAHLYREMAGSSGGSTGDHVSRVLVPSPKRDGHFDHGYRAPPSPPTLYGRTGTPEEMAAVVAFFASDEASYITGQTLSVTGGRFMF